MQTPLRFGQVVEVRLKQSSGKRLTPYQKDAALVKIANKMGDEFGIFRGGSCVSYQVTPKGQAFLILPDGLDDTQLRQLHAEELKRTEGCFPLWDWKSAKNFGAFTPRLAKAWKNVFQRLRPYYGSLSQLAKQNMVLHAKVAISPPDRYRRSDVQVSVSPSEYRQLQSRFPQAKS